MPFVTPRRDSIRYDGTNGEYIAGTWCTAIGLVSDTGAVLTYTDRDGYKQTANVGDWFIISGTDDGYPSVLGQDAYETYYVEIPPMPT